MVAQGARVCCDAKHTFQAVYNVQHIPIVLYILNNHKDTVILLFNKANLSVYSF